MTARWIPRTLVGIVPTLLVAFAVGVCWQRGNPMATEATAQEARTPHVVHNVYFTLHDSTPANRQKLVEACQKYLTGHQGTVYFSAGMLCDKLARPVNDRGFDVGLHIVFKSLADHDVYQDHPRHLQFIAENKATWKQVRVFDSEVQP